MIVAIIIISLAFGWLLKESRFLTIRLECGGIPSKSERVSAADDSKPLIKVIDVVFIAADFPAITGENIILGEVY
ncbi:hypothetical protein LCGC14_1226990 [marine sediment metagenome]|uniref:Uncharacterized protein n=1 Tax=marine sediment metagenome TaxID=412755 RepID=A0A0F9PDZ9_9ZZZZ